MGRNNISTLDGEDYNGYGDSSSEDEDSDMPFSQLPPLPPDNINAAQLYSLMMIMHTQLAVNARANVETRKEMQEIRTKLIEDKEERAAMLETWRAAKGVVTVIKFLGTIGISIAGIFGAYSIFGK